jgi:hypothetical protein
VAHWGRITSEGTDGIIRTRSIPNRASVTDKGNSPLLRTDISDGSILIVDKSSDDKGFDPN